ncbi:hypothetical protein [uncultured Algibacter sp.]|uniref:hypothetical protein n=1 Tax=uncultured Algibacter sp. TaxID=298659 RepID=UPI00261C11C2|nr:hypothetical protein [uncultured Algibacter sp.]
MKHKFILAISLLFILNSCSINNDTSSTPEQTFRSFWHLVSVEGGIAGIDDQFELNTVIWSFDEDNDDITVENNNTDDTKQDGLDSGVYPFEIVPVDSKQILVIDGLDFGEIYFTTQNTLIIDENETTTGPGADGFLYTFQRVVVAQ